MSDDDSPRNLDNLEKKVYLRGSEKEERKLARQNEQEWLWGLCKGHNKKTHATYWELQVI